QGGDVAAAGRDGLSGRAQARFALRRLNRMPATMTTAKAASPIASMIGPVLPAPIALPRGPQSTVAAAFSHAMRPVMNAAQTSVQRFSCAVIWPRSKRRCRVETLILPNLVNRTIQ